MAGSWSKKKRKKQTGDSRKSQKRFTKEPDNMQVAVAVWTEDLLWRKVLLLKYIGLPILLLNLFFIGFS